MRNLLKAGILLALVVFVGVAPMTTSGPFSLTNVHALLSMPNPEYTLQANLNGWNSSQSSGTNPTIFSVFLFPGQTLTANTYAVDTFPHSFAYYQPGTLPSQVSQFDACGPGSPCLASVSVTSSSPSAPVTLQFAFASANTFELYCQHHPFSMHAKVFLYRSPDINGDHAVNIVDLVNVAIALGTNSTSPGFRPGSDLNRDNQVNIVDLVIVAVNLGRTL